MDVLCLSQPSVVILVANFRDIAELVGVWIDKIDTRHNLDVFFNAWLGTTCTCIHTSYSKVYSDMARCNDTLPDA